VDITVEIGDHMVVAVSYGSRRTDKAAAQAGYAVFQNLHLRFPGLLVERETFGWADIETKSASAAGFLFNFHLKHFHPSSVCG
jgi:hypothetical protein